MALAEIAPLLVPEALVHVQNALATPYSVPSSARKRPMLMYPSAAPSLGRGGPRYQHPSNAVLAHPFGDHPTCCGPEDHTSSSTRIKSLKPSIPKTSARDHQPSEAELAHLTSASADFSSYSPVQSTTLELLEAIGKITSNGHFNDDTNQLCALLLENAHMLGGAVDYVTNMQGTNFS